MPRGRRSRRRRRGTRRGQIGKNLRAVAKSTSTPIGLAMPHAYLEKLVVRSNPTDESLPETPTSEFELVESKQSQKKETKTSVQSIRAGVSALKTSSAAGLARVSGSLVRDEMKPPLPDEKKALHSSLALLGKGLGGMFTHGNFKLVLAGTPTVNSSAGKFLQFIATTTTSLLWSNLSVASEFTTLDALFDEVFIHSVTLVYKPQNKYSAISTAKTAADTNTCAALIFFLPSGAPAFGDSSAVFQNAAVTSQHKLVNMGENWTFSCKNTGKFSWDGPTYTAGAGNTKASGWMLFNDVSTYMGGAIYMATNLASGAAAGWGNLFEGGVFGDYLAYYDISVRQRA